jgi:hypothetical protein
LAAQQTLDCIVRAGQHAVFDGGTPLGKEVGDEVGEASGYFLGDVRRQLAAFVSNGPTC